MRKELKLKLYKIQTCQVLTNLNKTKRVVFSEKFLTCEKNDKSFLDRVIFSDEAYFILSGLVNKQNTGIGAILSQVQLKRKDSMKRFWCGQVFLES